MPEVRQLGDRHAEFSRKYDSVAMLLGDGGQIATHSITHVGTSFQKRPFGELVLNQRLFQSTLHNRVSISPPGANPSTAGIASHSALSIAISDSLRPRRR